MSASTKKTFDFYQHCNGSDKITLVDYEEFDQSKYIQKGLHDNLPTKSVFAEGVCAALCLYTLVDWLDNNSSRKDPVSKLSSDADSINDSKPTLQTICDYASYFDNLGGTDPRDAFNTQVTALTAANNTPTGNDFEIVPSVAIEKLQGKGPTFIAMGGIVSTGHAILCDGLSRVVFDPNYGFWQTGDDDSQFFWLFKALMAKYDNYKDNTGAMTLYYY